MLIQRKNVFHVIVLFLTGLSATVFDSCGEMNTLNNPDAPTSCCYTDPPVGCAVGCPANLGVGVGDGFDFITSKCDGAGSGPQAQAFIDYMLNIQDQAHKNGTFPCTVDNSGFVYTPCGNGFQPSLNPSNQDTETCIVPQLDCSIPVSCIP